MSKEQLEAKGHLDNIHLSNAFQFVPKLPDKSIHLIICDGPYGVTDHEWDNIDSIQSYNMKLLRMFYSKLVDGGAVYLFGKSNCVDFIDYRPNYTLENRIIWFQPSRLSQGKNTYTNNYDVICYFLKDCDEKHAFNLDDIRIPQIVDGVQQERCRNVPSVQDGRFAAQYNPRGKNPGDVWTDIRQLTYKSKELVNREKLNTIQKPEKLIERLILASSNENDVVLDPFTGTGTVPTVCTKLNRHFVAIDNDPEMFEIAQKRVRNADGIQNKLTF